MNYQCTALILLTAVSCWGCATTRTSDTARTGMEQMLISNAIDQAVSRVNLEGIAGRKVFLEEKYLDCVDKNYVIGSLRHRILDTGALLVDAREEADVVMEPRSGGVGTDNSDRYVGMPGIALPGPMPFELPEVRFWEKKSQFGTAKVAVMIYDARTRQPLAASGTQLARSDNSQWSILGMSPGPVGSVHRELSTAPNNSTLLPSAIANRMDEFKNR